mgnify:CR=1 FL=1
MIFIVRDIIKQNQPRPRCIAEVEHVQAARLLIEAVAVAADTDLVLAAAPLALTLTSGLSGAGWEAQGSVANQVRDELRADFPELGAESAIVVYRQEQPIVSDPSGLTAVVDQLRGAPGAASVQAWVLARTPDRD